MLLFYNNKEDFLRTVLQFCMMIWVHNSIKQEHLFVGQIKNMF